MATVKSSAVDACFVPTLICFVFAGSVVLLHDVA